MLSDPGALANNLDHWRKRDWDAHNPKRRHISRLNSGAIGNLPGGVGTVTVTGAGSSWSNAGNMVVGGQGTGTLIIQDGATAQDGTT